MLIDKNVRRWRGKEGWEGNASVASVHCKARGCACGYQSIQVSTRPRRATFERPKITRHQAFAPLCPWVGLEIYDNQ